MSQPSPKAHLVRLAAVLCLALVGFLFIKALLTPDSWNYEDWYRGDALTLNASYDVVYGGNASCETCHEDVNAEMAEFKHQALSCESCHGPLGDHAKDGAKFADAFVDDETTWQCLNCHEERVNKPEAFPQFRKTTNEDHRDMDAEMLCIACHTPHDPVP